MNANPQQGGFICYRKWTWFAIGYQCGFAYAIALCINQIGGVFTGNFNVIGFLCALAIIAGMIYMLFFRGRGLRALRDARRLPYEPDRKRLIVHPPTSNNKKNGLHNMRLSRVSGNLQLDPLKRKDSPRSSVN